jgi:hypothetical protein
MVRGALHHRVKAVATLPSFATAGVIWGTLLLSGVRALTSDCCLTRNLDPPVIGCVHCNTRLPLVVGEVCVGPPANGRFPTGSEVAFLVVGVGRVIFRIVLRCEESVG